MTTTISDIHPDLIQTHILPFLDGPSLSATAAVSSHLQTLCADDILWSNMCNSTWPSVTDPRVDDIISTFPAGHRSFFHDSFPALVITDATHHNRRRLDLPSHAWPSQIISAVNIRYQNDCIYSKLEFTDTTDAFLSSEFCISLDEEPESKPGTGIFQAIKLKVDELAGADEGRLSHLKESLALNWILIDPTWKRAGNISSIKPVSAWKGWMNDNIHVLYAVVLPGCDQNNMVQYRIQVVLGIDEGTSGLHVKEVMLELLDMDFCRLKGKDFLVITQGALSGENNVKRKIVDVEESRRRYREFERISINSLSHLQSEIKTDMVISMPCDCFLQKLFHLLKVKFSLKTREFFSCMMLVVVLMIYCG
ncbi:hypothetical protein LXL04_038876 [Taraxacum kok-saghyz]